MSTDPVSSSSPILPTLPETSQNFTELHTSPDPALPAPTPVQVQRTPAEDTHHSLPACSPRPLTARQLSAIPLILQGQSDREVAQAIGVTRESICAWRNRHPRFIAEINRQRQLLQAETIDRYHRLLHRAMGYVERYQNDYPGELSDQVKLATTLLRSASRRTLAPTLPPPTNPADILDHLLSQGLPPAPDDSPANDAPPPPPPTPKKRGATRN